MPTLEDGQLFERYRINRWLGSGIAGESYEAEDRILQRKVTLKLIHPWATLPDSARRQFFREMQGISLLSHSYLATVLDYGELDGRIYVVRRYVSSGSLLGTNGRLWFHPPLPVADAFKCAHQLAQALQYIHQHGYLHGSLALGNVLVLRGPNAEEESDYAPFLIADVGLSNFVRRFGRPRIETQPVSAAPEQLGRRVTPASDQFALAVLLYFWLSGRPPYLGTPDEVEQLKLSETITPLSMLNPGISLEQDGIILRALAAAPEKRHASVLTFSEALMESLNSPVQHFALTISVEAERQEAPPEFLHTSPDGFSVNLPLESTKKITEEQPAEITETPPVQEVEPAPSAASDAEPGPSESGEKEAYRPPLPELSPIPQTEPGSASPMGEIDPSPLPEGAAEHLPAIPETPQVEEGAFPIEIELVLSSPAEAAAPPADQPASPADTEAVTEPPALPGSRAEETQVEQPASAEIAPLDEPPATREEAILSSPPDATLAPAEEITPAPSAPLDETPAPTDENALSPADEPHTAPEETSTARLPASIEEMTTAASQTQDEAAPAEPIAPANLSVPAAEASPTTPADAPATTASAGAEDATLTVAQKEPATTAGEDTAPAVPLEEPTVLAEEIVPAASSEQTEIPPAEPAQPVDAPAPATEEVVADTQAPTEETLPAAGEEPQSSDELASEQTVNDSPGPVVPVVETEGTNGSGASPRPQETAGTTSEIYQPAESTLAAPRLIVSSPYTNSSYEFPLANGETNIGRAGASDLVLEQDDLTSRHHALLKRTGEHVLIFDKRSHNGVFINGQKIEAERGYELADGDHIGIGNYELIFRSASGSQVSQLI